MLTEDRKWGAGTGDDGPPFWLGEMHGHSTLCRRLFWGTGNLNLFSIPVLSRNQTYLTADRIPAAWSQSPNVSLWEVHVHHPCRPDGVHKRLDPFRDRLLHILFRRPNTVLAKSNFLGNISNHFAHVPAAVLQEVCDHELGLPRLRFMRVNMYRAIGGVVQEPYRLCLGVDDLRERIVQAKVRGQRVNQRITSARYELRKLALNGAKASDRTSLAFLMGFLHLLPYMIHSVFQWR